MIGEKEHTFVVCAYKESAYIEECILSLKNQGYTSKIIMSTATPSKYLEDICVKYDIPYHVRDGKPGIGVDWNYALSLAETDYVTIAHQDDIYEPDYIRKLLEAMKWQEENGGTVLIGFSDYSELVNGIKYFDRRNLKIKRLLLGGLKNSRHQSMEFYKRNALRLGNAICCPSVTYNKRLISRLLKQTDRKDLFESHFRSNLDWETWEWLSKKKGAFVYVPETLMAHRIHEESETTATIQEKKRAKEDYQMFCKFWPKWIAKMLVKQYVKSEETNQV